MSEGISDLLGTHELPDSQFSITSLGRRSHIRVVTFYSYKGGVGRSMALANVAYRLANKHGKRVVMVDWDLEAPGLHRFFGISDETAAQSPGVLDFLLAWRDGYRKIGCHPPYAEPWLLSIDQPPYKPRLGSLSILTAGKQDDTYGKRLAEFDWDPFYKERGGMTGVERLREQLLECSDIVLIDSRTGFNESSGVCTVQLPDGVVLMTVPNEQSLHGTKRAARGFRFRRPSLRPEPNAAIIWLAVCRVPLVEEQEATSRWFQQHSKWFATGLTERLWDAEEHPDGLRSYELPHRSRWSLGEHVLHDGIPDLKREPLSQEYNKLAAALLLALQNDAFRAEQSSPDEPDREKQVALFQQKVDEAERRGNATELGTDLLALALAQRDAGKLEDGFASAQRAADVFLAQGNTIHIAAARTMLAEMRRKQGRLDEALALVESAQEVSEDVHLNSMVQWNIFRELGTVRFKRKDYEEALSAFKQALALPYSRERYEDRILVLNGMAFCSLALQQPDEALMTWERALEEIKNGDKLGRVDHQALGEVYIKLAEFHWKQQHTDQFIEYLKCALHAMNIGNKHGGKDPKRIAALEKAITTAVEALATTSK